MALLITCDWFSLFNDPKKYQVSHFHIVEFGYHRAKDTHMINLTLFGFGISLQFISPLETDK